MASRAVFKGLVGGGGGGVTTESEADCLILRYEIPYLTGI